MFCKEDIHLIPVDLVRHKKVCVEFLRDSFFVSFGDSKFWERTFGRDGARYISWLSEYNGLMLHAWYGEQIIGELMTDLDTAYLQHMYVIPELRGKGLGTIIHTYFVALLRERGLEAATLKVSRTNIRAIRFYMHCCWQYFGADSVDKKLDVYRLCLKS